MRRSVLHPVGDERVTSTLTLRLRSLPGRHIRSTLPPPPPPPRLPALVVSVSFVFAYLVSNVKESQAPNRGSCCLLSPTCPRPLPSSTKPRAALQWQNEADAKSSALFTWRAFTQRVPESEALRATSEQGKFRRCGLLAVSPVRGIALRDDICAAEGRAEEQSRLIARKLESFGRVSRP